MYNNGNIGNGNIRVDGFDRDEIRRAIEASELQAAIEASELQAAIEASELQAAIEASKKLNHKREVLTPEGQRAEANRRFAENRERGQAANYNSERVQPRVQIREEQVSSCNCKSIFVRGVKIAVGVAALGLAGYVAYNNVGAIQNVIGSLQGVGMEFITKIAELAKQNGLTYGSIQGVVAALVKYLNEVATISLVFIAKAKDVLANLPMKTVGKLAIGGLLLLCKVHKAVANVVIFLAKAVRNHYNLILAAVLLAVVVAYVPQANQYAAPYLTKALGHLTTFASNAHVEQAVNFLSTNAKLIGIALFDLMVLGFVHKAVDKCLGRDGFVGVGNRLA